MRLKHLFRATALITSIMAVMALAGTARADVWTDQSVYHAGDSVGTGCRGLVREEHPDLGRNRHREDDSSECPRGPHSR